MIQVFRISRNLTVAVLLALAAAGYGYAASDADRVKAAFVFNFIKFVEWPAESFDDPDAPIYVCVWGTKSTSALLATLHDKTAKSRAIHVLYTRDAGKLARCHVLYVSKSSAGAYRSIIRGISGRSILSISDISEFAENGGLIGLYRSDNQMRFAINLKATQASGLRMSSTLLKFGKIVQTREP